MTKREIADAYAGKDCTLDGEPARIVGRCLPFARVRSDTQDVEFAWETIRRVMEEGGRFHS